ncbi:hypothetical protein HYH02_007680 [Chlamydomonas schloesseri]|uniref:Uncharacterized protein n=1 Tax=Chlamydomonas schloesseri TaxID=2026947 RepID=A0A836B4D0_9CHLO|nr:hypothetical protein HYH02_007680 [Chlamydomonas schloesseri]|eukprot:KAG2447351.1 hypothetical protein HYH02_007680 [Chlamydomonas schloesseri]
MVQQLSPTVSPAKARVAGRDGGRDPSSPGATRRKAVLLDSLRKESGWPIANILLILILIGSAAVMVLYLGSRTGSRLGALKTYWLPGSGVISGLAPCTTLECARARAADDGALAIAAAEEAAAEAGEALVVPVTGTVAAAAAAAAAVASGGSGSGGVGSSGSMAAGAAGAPAGVVESTGTAAGATSTGGGGGGASTGKSSTVTSSLQGALSGLTGFLGLDKTKGAAGAGSAANGSAAATTAPGVLSVLDVLPLTAEDALKFDFDFWLAEGGKIAGAAASTACAEGYGLPLIERWRKSRTELCQPGWAGRRRTLQQRSSRALLRDMPADGGAAAAGGNGTAASKPPPARSRIDVFPFKDKRATNMFAAAENTVVDASAFLGGTPGEMPAAPRGSYSAACTLVPERLQSLQSQAFTEVENVKRWLVDALQADEYAKVAKACVPPVDSGAAAAGGGAARKSGPVLHPVLLLTRWDTTNAFHSLEEVVTAFISLAVLNDERLVDQGLQVAIADGKPDGYYLDVWASLSRPYPLRILSRNPWAPGTCLSRALHNTFAGTSLLTSMGADMSTTCRSPVVAGAALWLRHMLAPAIQPPARSGFKVPLQNKGVVRKTIVWVSRRNFEAQKRDSFTSWQQTRMFQNEGELVLQLQREVWRWNDENCMRSGLARSFPDSNGGRRLLLSDRLQQRRAAQLRRLLAQLDGRDDDTAGTSSSSPADEASALDALLEQDSAASASSNSFSAIAAAAATGAGSRRRSLQGGSGGGGKCRQSSVFFDLRVLELSDLAFYPDQLQVLGNAAVVAGGHGAGLANMMWMPPGKGGVLELHHNSGGNQHYHNLAYMLGHRYAAVESGGESVDTQAAARGLRGLMDALGL